MVISPFLFGDSGGAWREMEVRRYQGGKAEVLWDDQWVPAGETEFSLTISTADEIIGGEE